MPDIEGDDLIAVKENLLGASNSLMRAFDEIEFGEATPEAALAVVDAHERLMKVHAAFKVVSQQRLLDRY